MKHKANKKAAAPRPPPPQQHKAGREVSWCADIIETAVIPTPTVSCATHQAKADVEKQVLAQRPLVAALQHAVHST
jgi:hypothetical protein